MTTWNYRLIKHDEDEENIIPSRVWYGLHEVYYEHDKSIRAWTDDPLLVSDTPEEMFDILEMIKHDLEKHEILVYSEIS